MIKIKNLIFEVLAIIFPYILFELFRKIIDKIHSIHLSNKMNTRNINAEYRIIFETLGKYDLRIGKNLVLRKDAWIGIYATNGIVPKLYIGDNVHCNFSVHIGCINEIKIGDNVLIASRTLITDHYHGNTDIDTLLIHPKDRKLVSPGKVIIGNNVLIGENVVILPNVTIGNNVVIGANSVVTKNIPSNSVYGGNTAKNLKDKENNQ